MIGCFFTPDLYLTCNICKTFFQMLICKTKAHSITFVHELMFRMSFWDKTNNTERDSLLKYIDKYS